MGGASSPPPLHGIQTDSVAHPASYSMDTGVLSRVYSTQGVKLTTHFHLVLRFWVVLFHLYAFMAFDRKKTLLFHLYLCSN